MGFHLVDHEILGIWGENAAPWDSIAAFFITHKRERRQNWRLKPIFKHTTIILLLFGFITIVLLLLFGDITDQWLLYCSVWQGCPLSALLFAIATHPMTKYKDLLVATGALHGLETHAHKPLIAQAYADDSFFFPRNSQTDLSCVMSALSLFGLAVGLCFNFLKSKLLPLQAKDCHHILWPANIVQPMQLVCHLGFIWVVSHSSSTNS